jgi:hypothetical protein
MLENNKTNIVIIKRDYENSIESTILTALFLLSGEDKNVNVTVKLGKNASTVGSDMCIIPSAELLERIFSDETHHLRCLISQRFLNNDVLSKFILKRLKKYNCGFVCHTELDIGRVVNVEKTDLVWQNNYKLIVNFLSSVRLSEIKYRRLVNMFDHLLMLKEYVRYADLNVIHDTELIEQVDDGVLYLISNKRVSVADRKEEMMTNGINTLILYDDRGISVYRKKDDYKPLFIHVTIDTILNKLNSRKVEFDKEILINLLTIRRPECYI